MRERQAQSRGRQNVHEAADHNGTLDGPSEHVQTVEPLAAARAGRGRGVLGNHGNRAPNTTRRTAYCRDRREHSRTRANVHAEADNNDETLNVSQENEQARVSLTSGRGQGRGGRGAGRTGRGRGAHGGRGGRGSRGPRLTPEEYDMRDHLQYMDSCSTMRVCAACGERRNAREVMDSFPAEHDMLEPMCGELIDIEESRTATGTFVMCTWFIKYK